MIFCTHVPLLTYHIDYLRGSWESLGGSKAGGPGREPPAAGWGGAPRPHGLRGLAGNGHSPRSLVRRCAGSRARPPPELCVCDIPAFSVLGPCRCHRPEAPSSQRQHHRRKSLQGRSGGHICGVNGLWLGTGPWGAYQLSEVVRPQGEVRGGQGGKWSCSPLGISLPRGWGLPEMDCFLHMFMPCLHLSPP